MKQLAISNTLILVNILIALFVCGGVFATFLQLYMHGYQWSMLADVYPAVKGALVVGLVCLASTFYYTGRTILKEVQVFKKLNGKQTT